MVENRIISNQDKALTDSYIIQVLQQEGVEDINPSVINRARERIKDTLDVSTNKPNTTRYEQPYDLPQLEARYDAAQIKDQAYPKFENMNTENVVKWVALNQTSAAEQMEALESVPNSTTQSMNYLDSMIDAVNKESAAIAKLLEEGVDGAKIEDSTKAKYMDFLHAVLDKIATAKKQLAEMQELELIYKKGKVSAELDAIQEQSDKKLKQLEEQRRIAEKARKAAAKQRKLGLVMKIISPIILVVSVAVTIATFGAAGPLAVGIMALSIAAATASTVMTYTNAKGLDIAMKVICGALGDALAEIPGVNKRLAKAIGNFVAFAIVIVGAIAAAATGNLGVLAATATYGSTMFSTLNPVTDAMLAAGYKEGDQAVMITSLVLSSVVAISAMGASVYAMTRNLGQTIRNISNQIGEVNTRMAIIAQEGRKASVEYITLLLKRSVLLAAQATANGEEFGSLFEYVEKGARLGLAGVKVHTNILEMEQLGYSTAMSKSKTTFEKENIEIEMFIQSLKDLIKHLEAVLENMTSMGVSFNDLANKTIQDQRNAMNFGV